MRKHIEALISNFLFAAMGLLSFMLLSRGTSQALFGEWMLFLSLSTFFDLVRFGLTRGAVVRLIAGARDHTHSHHINASGLQSGIIILAAISALFYAAWGVLHGHVDQTYLNFLVWYPAVGAANLLWNNAMSWLQANSRFAQITVLRSINMGTFIGGLLILIYTKNVSFANLLWIYLLANALSSLYGTIRGWDSVWYLPKGSVEYIRQIMRFGRYSVGATLGSSLLKSADSFIISLSPVLGVSGVAIYAIPFKVVEMLELPIRSIATVGYNHFSKTVLEGNPERLRNLSARYIIMMLAVTLPVMVVIGCVPDVVLGVLGGANYESAMPQMRAMLYLLLIYGVVLIPDRITGVTLEALGHPQLNMYKVLLMVVFNIAGDLIAVFVFESLLGVVLATVVFATVGVTAGYLLISRSARASAREFRREFQLLKSELWIIIGRGRARG